MSYEPTNWKTGDVVTSAKLNKLENGVANSGGVMVVHKVAYNGELTAENYQLDKTWQEITDALRAGTIVISIEERDGGITQENIYTTVTDDEGSTYYVCSFQLSYPCGTESATGYPHYPFGEGGGGPT